jgi:hypothetical protein
MNVETINRIVPVDPPKNKKKKAAVVPSMLFLYKNLMNKVSVPKHNDDTIPNSTAYIK